MRDVSGREVRFAGDGMTGYLCYAMKANAMAYALRMSRLRREARDRHALLRRQLDEAEGARLRAQSQIAGWYGGGSEPPAP